MSLPNPSAAATIGLEERCKPLSSADADALLRMLLMPTAEDRTYSSVQLSPPADGQSLYVRPH